MKKTLLQELLEHPEYQRQVQDMVDFIDSGLLSGDLLLEEQFENAELNYEILNESPYHTLDVIQGSVERGEFTADRALAYLAVSQLIIDLNTESPTTKEQIAMETEPATELTCRRILATIPVIKKQKAIREFNVANKQTILNDIEVYKGKLHSIFHDVQIVNDV